MNIRVYTGYDPVKIVSINSNSTDADLQKVADKAGLTGSFESITDADIPVSREDRDSWEVQGGKVKVNAVKKAAKDAEKQAKKDAKNATLIKLGITEEELKDLLD